MNEYHWQKTEEELQRRINTLYAANEWQCNRLKEAEEALRFYADESNWFGAPAKAYSDSGRKARFYFAQKWNDTNVPLKTL